MIHILLYKKTPLFCVKSVENAIKSVKIYTGQFFFYTDVSVVSVTNMRYDVFIYEQNSYGDHRIYNIDPFKSTNTGFVQIDTWNSLCWYMDLSSCCPLPNRAYLKILKFGPPSKNEQDRSELVSCSCCKLVIALLAQIHTDTFCIFFACSLF